MRLFVKREPDNAFYIQCCVTWLVRYVKISAQLYHKLNQCQQILSKICGCQWNEKMFEKALSLGLMPGRGYLL